MSESRSLYESAMAELDVNVTPDEYIRMLGPDCIRGMAVDQLTAEGIVLVGHPTLVARVLDSMIEDVKGVLSSWTESNQAFGRGGRPKNNPTHNLILTAAFHAAQGEGSGKTAARRAAARRLGGGITKDKVEKAERVFLRDMSRALGSLPIERMLQLTALYLLRVEKVLERIEAELRDAEASAARKRRFYVPADDCFRAASGSSVVGPQD
jgi:hypothetical protein